MSTRTFLIFAVLTMVCAGALLAAPENAARRVAAAPGEKLIVDLETGGSVEVTGTGGSSVSLTYTPCAPDCSVEMKKTGDAVRITARHLGRRAERNEGIDLRIEVPARFDLELSSMGGSFSIQGVEGTFTGETHGGELTLRDVRGRAELSTMGGGITVTDSDLDGELSTMGGEVLFQNIVGDVKGSSMGGNVRYRNVRRRGGEVGAPSGTKRVPEAGGETVQISTMGGEIDVDDAPEGANLKTMGGDIRVRNARRFVRATTYGGSIAIEEVDGWIEATTMGGDIEASLAGKGGDVTLTSMSGDITLHVPPRFGMDLDLEVAFTRDSGQDYGIEVPGGPKPTVTPEWEHDEGTPRKRIRSSGPVNGGGHAVKIRTVNGDIRIVEGK